MFDQKTNDVGFGHGAVIDLEDKRDFVFSGMNKPFDWELGFDIELLLGYRKWSGSQEVFFGPRGRAGWGYERYKEIAEEVKSKNIPPFIIAPKNQNGSYSCTGQGASMYLSVINFIETGEWVEFSAKDIYKAISLGFGQGAQLRDAMKRCVDPGVATEDLVPSYENGKPPSEGFMLTGYTETEQIKQARKIFASKEYKVISWDPNWIDAFAWATLLNFGVYGGVIGSNNGTWYTLNPKVPVDGQEFWGHAIFFGKVKKQDLVKQIGLINSWGNAAGQNGWQFLTENWMSASVQLPGQPIRSSVIFNPWTLTDKANNINNDSMIKNFKVKIITPKGTSFGVFTDTPNTSIITKAEDETEWRSYSKQDSYQVHTVNPDGSTDWSVDFEINLPA